MFQPEGSELFKLFSPVIIICFEFYGVRIIKIEVESLDTKEPGIHTHTPSQRLLEIVVVFPEVINNLFHSGLGA